MKRKIFLLLASLAFSSIVLAQIPKGVEDAAREYKGYDELIDSTTIVEYKSKEYYYVAYSKSLMYSGFLLLDEEGNQVKDKDTITYFAVADILFRNYPKNSTTDWARFQSYFQSIPKSDDIELDFIQNDSKKIAAEMANSTYYLDKCLDSFSPDDAENYVKKEGEVITAMNESLGRIQGLGNHSNNAYAKEYRESLIGIKGILEANLNNLMSGADYFTENMDMRIKSPQDKSTEMTLIAVTFLVIALSVFLKIRASKR